MIYIRNNNEIEKIASASEIVKNTLFLLEEHIEPGISTIELDSIAEKYICSQSAKPGFKGLYGYPSTICVSIDSEVVHGIPSKRKLKDGEIVSIDVGSLYKGYYGDHAKTFSVGSVDSLKKDLMTTTKDCLYEGINYAKPGMRIGDIGNAIQTLAESKGYSVVKDLVGHGIGEKLHEEPQIPNYGDKGTGPIIKEGMCFAIEPMINMGKEEVYEKEDGWTVCTRDGQPSAHFEHTITITKNGPQILTA